ncbi:alcohol dehydrogenase [Coraliomargarita sinensis]|uniref:Alcohol dehydrogenase n=1 Tax=Coraliomargarita sinensis TaxID=2174842 RepID=A0A317ZQA8_9BACT|nr:SDR family NAD(P)-dependent oxidoreductase [Coraliomargarita sinensis]PXA05601.1 alcohol dehydrogenase [Coraliomargarita sinensis]
MAEKILITGVSSGLGHGLAKAYLEQGATVYGCSRRKPDDLIEAGLHYQSVDLLDAEHGQKAFEELIHDVSRFDAVILNAAKLGEIRDMADTPLDDLRGTMEINVWANKWLLDTIYSSGKTVKQVVAISSGASISGSRGWNGYSLSKAALNMLIKLYAGERPETHFTSLAPGLVDTEMQDYLTNLPADDRFKPLDILKAAKGTEKMPDGDRCAKMLIEIFPKLLERESGEFTDIRKM